MKTVTEKALLMVEWVKKTKGLPVYQIEDRCGISRGSIGKWGGKGAVDSNLSATNVAKLLQAFPEVSADWMMRDDEVFQMVARVDPPVIQADYMLKRQETWQESSKNKCLEEENKRLIDEVAALKKRLKTAMEYSLMLQEMLGK